MLMGGPRASADRVRKRIISIVPVCLIWQRGSQLNTTSTHLVYQMISLISRFPMLRSVLFEQSSNRKGIDVAKGQQRGNREAKKPKKEKIKVIAAAPSRNRSDL